MKHFFKYAAILFISHIANANTGQSCLSNRGFGEIPNGGSITGYETSMSLPGFPCSSMTVTCVDGVLSGPDLYPTCSDILQDCQGLPNRSSVSGYQSPSAPCIPSTVTCTNGILSGPVPFPSCSE